MAGEIFNQMLRSSEGVASLFLGGMFGVLFALGILFIILFIIALYVYSSLAWMTIAKKLRYKYPWLAWIPIANIAMMLQLGGFYWAWVFLIVVPFVGWIALLVLTVIATWKIGRAHV